jgi:hypothetical protein
VLGDAAYDAERTHALCRDRLGIPEAVFRLNRRNTGRKWPRSPDRRAMRRAFPRATSNQRWQVESALSRHKRLLGPSLRGHSRPAQKAETLLRVLTHNLMLLADGSPYGFNRATPALIPPLTPSGET